MASASEYLSEGIKLFRQGSYAECLELLQQTLAENPKDVNCYLYLAYVYAHQNKYDECTDILEKAVDVAPTSAKVHYNLGVAYQKQHNMTEAKDEFLRALGLDPSYPAPKEALDFLDAAHAEHQDQGESQQNAVAQ